MIGIVVVTHGRLAEGMIDAMELICGKQEKVVPYGLRMEDDLEVFSTDVIKKAYEINDGDGVLLLADFVGGSPANVLGKLLLQEDDMEGVAGVNFPMLIEAVKSRDDCVLKELTEQCVAVGTMGIVDIKERIKKLMDEEE